jgi:hypothetical protein
MLAIHDAIVSQGDLPAQVVPVVAAAMNMWRGLTPIDPEVLLQSKEAIWDALQAKNGNSTTIVDSVDRTLRASLCLVESDEADAHWGDHADWAAEMLSIEPWPRQARLA